MERVEERLKVVEHQFGLRDTILDLMERKTALLEERIALLSARSSPFASTSEPVDDFLDPAKRRMAEIHFDLRSCRRRMSEQDVAFDQLTADVHGLIDDRKRLRQELHQRADQCNRLSTANEALVQQIRDDALRQSVFDDFDGPHSATELRNTLKARLNHYKHRAEIMEKEVEKLKVTLAETNSAKVAMEAERQRSRESSSQTVVQIEKELIESRQIISTRDAQVAELSRQVAASEQLAERRRLELESVEAQMKIEVEARERETALRRVADEAAQRDRLMVEQMNQLIAQLEHALHESHRREVEAELRLEAQGRHLREVRQQLAQFTAAGSSPTSSTHLSVQI